MNAAVTNPAPPLGDGYPAKSPYVELWREGNPDDGFRPLKSNIAFNNVGNHSPTGIECGYPGSGPAVLAGDMLIDAGLPKKRLEQRPAVYGQLKDELVARLPNGWPDDKVILAVYAYPVGDNSGKKWHIGDPINPVRNLDAPGRIYIAREDILAWVLDKFADFVTECDEEARVI